MVNPVIQGRVYPPTPPYLVGREKVREFARAVCNTSPLSHDPEVAQRAGYRDVIAPTTFPIVVQQLTLEQLLADPEAGVDFSRVVHGDQRFTYVRPIASGDELVGTMTVTSVKQLGGNAMITCATEISDERGDLVVTATSTIVVRAEDAS